MKRNSILFAALLAVAAVSILFGMILGTRLQEPAAPVGTPVFLPAAASPAIVTEGPVTVAPAAVHAPSAGFADVVADSVKAVVSVTNTQGGSGGGDSGVFDFFFNRNKDDDDDNDDKRPPTRGIGSGFIISPDGYVLTNNHVIENTSRLLVKLDDDREFFAEVVGVDPAIDLALLKLDAEGALLPTLQLGDSESLRVGEWVIAIGSPLDFNNSVTVGVVSAKGRRVPLSSTNPMLATFIQTDAAINKGNSGGPLLDASGRVIGINTAIHRGNESEGIGFALPINDARRAVEQLMTSGRVSRGYLGIELGRSIDAATADYYGLDDPRGVRIERVTPDQPADRAGLESDDIIRKLNGVIVRDNDDLIRIISGHGPGDSVEVEIMRDGRELTKTVHLIERTREATSATRRRGRSFLDPSGKIPDDHGALGEGLGLKVQSLESKDRKELQLEGVRGMRILDVNYNSPAGDIDLRSDIVIVAVNEEPTRNASEWDRAVAGLRPGEPVKLTFLYPGNQDSPQVVFLRAPD